MRNIFSFFTYVLLIILVPVTALATVTARIDRNAMVIDETLTLTLTKKGTSFFAKPDLQPVEKDFKVLSQSQSSTTQIINGSTSSMVMWKISLAPRRTGTLHIPPITVGKERSAPLSVEVSEPEPKTKADNRPIFLETAIDAHSVYVQSQVLFTLRLFSAIDARIAEPEDPHLQNGLLKRLNDATYDKMIQGQPYQVFERKYAIFPQKSGSFEIPSIIVVANVPSSKRSHSFYDPFNTTSERITLRSNPERIEVLEKPAQFPETELWLPANMVLIKDHWGGGNNELTVGESSTLSISLTADGLMGEQLPPLSLPESGGLKLYQGKAEIDNTITQKGIVGIRKESIALVPTRAGTFAIPEIRIPWWNKQTNKVEFVVLPARTFSVKAAPATVASSAPAANPEKETQPAQSSSQPESTVTAKWIILCSLLAAGWLITLTMLIRTRRKVRFVTKGEEDESSETSTLKEKKAFNAVTRSCRSNDPAAARKAVLNWLQTFLPEAGIKTFADVQKNIQDPDLLDQLYQLDKTLFDTGESISRWSGNNLLGTVQNLRKSRKKTGKPKKQLEPLYK